MSHQGSSKWELEGADKKKKKSPQKTELLKTQGFTEHLAWKEQSVKLVGKTRQEEAVLMLGLPFPRAQEEAVPMLGLPFPRAQEEAVPMLGLPFPRAVSSWSFSFVFVLVFVRWGVIRVYRM